VRRRAASDPRPVAPAGARLPHRAPTQQAATQGLSRRRAVRGLCRLDSSR
jgi:hypothetical protein